MPTLKRGSVGQEVLRLQIMLNRLSCGSLNQDGNFGPATESAVKVFQRKMNLDQDGKFGPKSQAAMEPFVLIAVGELTQTCLLTLQRDTNFQALEVLLNG